MKKRLFGRAIAVVTALSLAAGGLTACGGSGADDERNALAKENVYSFEEFKLPDLGGDYSSLLAGFRLGDRIYSVMRVEEYTSGSLQYHLVSFEMDGSDAKDVQLEMNKTVITDEEMQGADGADGQDAGYDDVIMPRSNASTTDSEDSDEGVDDSADSDEGTDDSADGDDGADETGDGDENAYESADGDENADEAGDVDIPADDSGMLPDGDIIIDEEYNYTDFWEYNSLDNIVAGSDCIFGIRNYNYSNYSMGYDTSRTYICCWNIDGSLKWESEVTLPDTWIQSIIPSQDGSVNLICSAESYYLVSVDAEGRIGEQKEMSQETQDVFRYLSYILRSGGKTFVFYNDANDWTKQYAAEYDPVSDKVGDKVEIPGNIMPSSNSPMMPTGEDGVFMYSTSSGLYSYRIGDQEAKKVLDYINSDINVTSLSYVIKTDDTHLIGMFYEAYDYENLKAGLFTYVAPEDITDKKVIVIAGKYINNDLKKRVIEYNRSSQEYRITIEDYGQYDNYGDDDAGGTRLNNDIIAGNMPDILVVNYGIPVENYIAKGWIADINEFIEEDEELSEKEFVQNVFDAYSVDGKLYYLIPSFCVNTVVGKKSVVGDRTGWTMEDMMKLNESLPEGSNMFEYMNRQNFIYYVMQFCGSDFVDVKTGKCSFNSQQFIDVLKFANSLPEEIEYPEDYWMNYESQYRDGRTILDTVYLSSLSRFNYTLNGTFGGDLSYIGFPSDNGKGAYVEYNEAYCIAEDSKSKDGAWEFLRYYLTDEYQNDTDLYAFPVDKDAFEKRAQEALEKPYYIDEQGNKQEYDEYFYMNGEEIVLEPMTKEQLEELKNYVCSIDQAYYYNNNVMEILGEEMEAYFQGQKSAEEVADIIQRRVQIYVDESR